MSTKFPTLHIYGQFCQHAHAFIAGNLSGLRALRDALDAAIANGEKSSTLVYAEDGEGYDLKVIWTTDEQLDQLPLPYTDPDFHRWSTRRIPDEWYK